MLSTRLLESIKHWVVLIVWVLLKVKTSGSKTKTLGGVNVGNVRYFKTKTIISLAYSVNFSIFQVLFCSSTLSKSYLS